MNVHFDKTGTLLRTTAEKHPPVIYDARGNGGGHISPTLTGDHQSRITDYTAIVLESGNEEDNDLCRKELFQVAEGRDSGVSPSEVGELRGGSEVLIVTDSTETQKDGVGGEDNSDSNRDS